LSNTTTVDITRGITGIDLKEFIKIGNRFFHLSLAQASVGSTVIGQYIARVDFYSLTEVGDCRIQVSIAHESDATIVVSRRIFGIEYDG